MPTRKEASKIKHDHIAKRKVAIKGKITLLEGKIYDNVVPEIIALSKVDKKQISSSQYNALQSEIKKTLSSGFPDVMKETAKAARTLNDLNLIYFSTMMDSNRLDEIRDKTAKIADRRLGIDEAGKVIKGGFIDKTLKTDKLQAEFINEVKKAIASNNDVQLLKEKIKNFITGSNQSGGLINRYYNTFASTILNNIDRSNGLVYADDLGLKYFYFAGGLILSSRNFCIDNNGKIIHRDQAQKWSSMLGQKNGPVWDEKRDGVYDPLKHMGGLGCLHGPDWISDDLAIGNIRDQNAIAKQRNTNFKERHDL